MSSPEVVAKSGASPSNTKAEGATAGEESPLEAKPTTRGAAPLGTPWGATLQPPPAGPPAWEAMLEATGLPPRGASPAPQTP